MSGMTPILTHGGSMLQDGKAKGIDIGAAVGQNGRAIRPEEYANSARYIKGNMVPMLLLPPELMRYSETYEADLFFLKQLVETWPKRVSGFNNTLNAQGAESEESSNATRFTPGFAERDQPSVELAIDELYGRSICRGLEKMIYGLIGDEHHKGFPHYMKTRAYEEEDPDTRVRPHEAAKTFAMLGYEMDPGGREITNAMMVVNLFPRTAGTSEMEKNVRYSPDGLEYTIPLGGIGLTNRAVTELCKDIIAEFRHIDVTVNTMAAFHNEIAPDVRKIQAGAFSAGTIYTP